MDSRQIQQLFCVTLLQRRRCTSFSSNYTASHSARVALLCTPPPVVAHRLEKKKKKVICFRRSSAHCSSAAGASRKSPLEAAVVGFASIGLVPARPKAIVAGKQRHKKKAEKEERTMFCALFRLCCIAFSRWKNLLAYLVGSRGTRASADKRVHPPASSDDRGLCTRTRRPAGGLWANKSPSMEQNPRSSSAERLTFFLLHGPDESTMIAMKDASSLSPALLHFWSNEDHRNEYGSFCLHGYQPVPLEDY